MVHAHCFFHCGALPAIKNMIKSNIRKVNGLNGIKSLKVMVLSSILAGSKGLPNTNALIVASDASNNQSCYAGIYLLVPVIVKSLQKYIKSRQPNTVSQESFDGKKIS